MPKASTAFAGRTQGLAKINAASAAFLLFFEYDIANIVDFFGDFIIQARQLFHFIAGIHNGGMVAVKVVFTQNL